MEKRVGRGQRSRNYIVAIRNRSVDIPTSKRSQFHLHEEGNSSYVSIIEAHTGQAEGTMFVA